MSSIARIFIVLNLLLAALCLGWASNHLGTAQNWKDKHNELDTTKQAEIDSLTGEVSTRNRELSTAKESTSRSRSERDQATAQYETATSELTLSREQEAQLRAAFDGMNQTMEGIAEGRDEAQSKFEAASAEAVAATEAKRLAEEAAKAAGDAQRDAEEALAAAERQIADLETANTTLTKSLSKTETELAVVIADTGVDPSKLIVQSDISGAVVTVSDKVKPGLVGINRGKADGVKRGYVFNLYSGNQFKGTAKVQTVEDNMCFATIESIYQDRVVTQGDKASTRL